MSDDEGPSSIGPSMGMHGDNQMNLFGWLIFLPLAFLLLPIAPFILLYWFLMRDRTERPGRGRGNGA